jgi:hypothetical protein
MRSSGRHGRGRGRFGLDGREMRLMRFIILAAVVIFAFVAPLELALRLVPSAIPLNLLIEFETHAAFGDRQAALPPAR